jgi:hypothetical protein
MEWRLIFFPTAEAAKPPSFHRDASRPKVVGLPDRESMFPNGDHGKLQSRPEPWEFCSLGGAVAANLEPENSGA